MLDVVTAQMTALGLIRPQSPVQCNAFIKLENVLVDLWDDDGRYYYVRLAEAYDLEVEHQIACEVARHLGTWVPRPLAFFRHQGLSCIVFEGIDFEVVTGRALLEADSGDRLGRGILEFMDGMVRSLRGSVPPVDLEQVLAGVDERFFGTEQDVLWRRVRAGLDRSELAGQPGQPQHGDFAPNNFGLRRAGLVVFDWEDYGKINLPGFDLAVLLASLVDFHPAELRALRMSHLAGQAVKARWLEQALRILQLDAGAFWRMVPFHLFLFLALKDRYSPKIRAKVADAIEGML